MSQYRGKQGRHACNRSGDGGACCRVVCAQCSGLEHDIYEPASEYAQHWNEPSAPVTHCDAPGADDPDRSNGHGSQGLK
jgi:hypothetical protein